jgi:hypothetical protein
MSRQAATVVIKENSRNIGESSIPWGAVSFDTTYEGPGPAVWDGNLFRPRNGTTINGPNGSKKIPRPLFQFENFWILLIGGESRREGSWSPKTSNLR